MPDGSLGDEVEAAEWRRLTITMPKPAGGVCHVELLRPDWWVELAGAVTGESIELSLPEMGLQGPAQVVAIGPCPPIEPGSGRVVTGTFHHDAGDVLDLHVAGQSAPIGITPNHPVYSVDRGDFVSAGQLRVGERMQQRDGPIAITALHPRPGRHPVFNIEVHTDHVYHVTSAGILVHNSYAGKGARGPATRRAPAPDNYRGRYMAERHAQGSARLPDDWDVHHRIPQEYKNHPELQGFDFHHPNNLQGVRGSRADVNVHQRITNEWADFRRQNPNATRAEIEGFAKQIDQSYAGEWFQ